MIKKLLKKPDVAHWLVGLGLILAGLTFVGRAVWNLGEAFLHEDSVFDMTESIDQTDGFLPAVDRIADRHQPGETVAPTLNALEEKEQFWLRTEDRQDVISDGQVLEQDPELKSGNTDHRMTDLNWVPDRVVIRSISLDAEIISAGLREVEYEGEMYQQWLAPDENAVGWHITSAPLGVVGNTVLNGHHNVYGEVFRDLEKLEIGDLIEVYSGERVYLYEVAARVILKERWQPLEVRLENARWLQASSDERLTLVTCWPYDSNTHRLVLAALPRGWANADSENVDEWMVH